VRVSVYASIYGSWQAQAAALHPRVLSARPTKELIALVSKAG